MTPRPDFPTPPAFARALLARGAPAIPVHVADQLDAAGAEVRVLHDRMGLLLPILEPARTWYDRVDAQPSDETRTHLLAAVMGCRYCVHLRRGGAQPVVVRLVVDR